MTESPSGGLWGSQPRRTSLSKSQRHEDEIWEPMNSLHHATPQGFGADDMDVELPISNSAIDTERLISPLKDVAEKVGREVEKFAEKLDAYRPKQDEPFRTKRAAISDLVNEYRNIADAKANGLGRRHDGDFQEQFRKAWFSSLRLAGGQSMLSNDSSEANNQLNGSTTVADLQSWKAESNTWQLVWTMINQISEDSPDQTEKPADSIVQSQANDRFHADGRTWAGYLRSSRARERLAVLKWLETTAEQTGNDINLIESELETNAGQGSGFHSYGWLDTKAKIKGQKRMRLWNASAEEEEDSLPEISNSENTELLVTQLDPDAVTRQGRHLEKRDSESEIAFWVVCWEMLKRGLSMDDIRHWCEDHNEFARAISLGAQAASANDQFSTSINSRLRWRRACLYLARHGGLNKYERAVYGLLGGDYESVLPVCKSWEDFIFAKYNQLLLHEYEEYVITNHPNLIPPESIRNFGMATPSLPDTEDFFRGFNLNTLSTSGSYGLGTDQPLKIIQNAVLSGDVKHLFWTQGIALSRQVKTQNTASPMSELVPKAIASMAPDGYVIRLIAENPDILRVLAHLFITYKDLGSDFGQGDYEVAVENNLCAYINFLRLSKKFTLIPLYASKLSEIRCTLTMARVLNDIHETGQRQDMMRLMESYNIDVVTVVKTHYEFAIDFSQLDRWQGQVLEFTGLNLLEPTKNEIWPGKRMAKTKFQDIEESDHMLIRSVEWFLCMGGHWRLMFEYLTDLAGRFLRAGLIGAAMELFKRMPYQDLSASKTPDLLGRRMNVMEDQDDSDNETTPALARTSRQRNRNSEVLAPPRSATPAKNRVLREMLQEYSRVYWEMGQLVAAIEALEAWRMVERLHIEETARSADRSRYNKTTREGLDNLIAAMEPLLRVGFLSTPGRLGGCDSSEELQKLRQAFLPELVIAYNSALHCAAHILTREQFVQSLELATLVAENEEIVKCFQVAGRMKELVSAFALTSKAMLRLNKVHGKTAKKKKGKSGKGLAVWDVNS